jgi:hypothetical protein
MINPEDEVLLDLRPSCTRDEAVAKLLGWLQGPIRRRIVDVTLDGISEDQLPTLHSLSGSVEQHLLERRNAAHVAFLEEAAKYPHATDDAAMDRRETAVRNCDEQIRRAAMYSRDIADELASDSASSLALDEFETKRVGEPCITLVSLDRWSRKKYGIAVLPQDEPRRQTELGAAFAQEDQELEDGSEGLSALAAHNLYVTFACLVHAYADAKGGKFKKAGKPNASSIAAQIETTAIGLAGRNAVTGQGHEKIRKRIAAAHRALDEALK